jgi:hypothetical protein
MLVRNRFVRHGKSKKNSWNSSRAEVIRASSTRFGKSGWRTGKEVFYNISSPGSAYAWIPVTDFSLRFDWKEHPAARRRKILNRPQGHLLPRKKISGVVILLDEFQTLASYNNYDSAGNRRLSGRMAAAKSMVFLLPVRKQTPYDVGRFLTTRQNRFYRFGWTCVFWKKSERNNGQASFKKDLKISGGSRSPKSLLLPIPRFMEDHSWYVQQLGTLYMEPHSKKSQRSRNVSSALDELIRANSPALPAGMQKKKKKKKIPQHDVSSTY